MNDGHNKVALVFRYNQQEPRYFEVTELKGPDCTTMIHATIVVDESDFIRIPLVPILWKNQCKYCK